MAVSIVFLQRIVRNRESIETHDTSPNSSKREQGNLVNIPQPTPAGGERICDSHARNKFSARCRAVRSGELFREGERKASPSTTVESRRPPWGWTDTRTSNWSDVCLDSPVAAPS